MFLREVSNILESWAPIKLAESYDNVGLQIGSFDLILSGILITLDCTEAVIDEALANNCNMIICHHPLIFGGIKKIDNTNYIHKVISKAIKNDIAIYAIHTNLDNTLEGVNFKIAELLGLNYIRPLSQKEELYYKLMVYIPLENFTLLRDKLFDANIGEIGNYSKCSFASKGVGTFKGNEKSNPKIGSQNNFESVEEYKLELLVDKFNLPKAISLINENHIYEEPTFDIIPIINSYNKYGSGLIGELQNELSLEPFLNKLKEIFELKSIKYTQITKKVKKVALCGGSGSFLINNAIGNKADVYITSDIKYHDFFDLDDKLSLIDIGHYESERFTKELIYDYLKKNIVSLPISVSKINTNPIKYFV